MPSTPTESQTVPVSITRLETVRSTQHWDFKYARSVCTKVSLQMESAMYRQYRSLHFCLFLPDIRVSIENAACSSTSCSILAMRQESHSTSITPLLQTLAGSFSSLCEEGLTPLSVQPYFLSLTQAPGYSGQLLVFLLLLQDEECSLVDEFQFSIKHSLFWYEHCCSPT